MTVAVGPAEAANDGQAHSLAALVVTYGSRWRHLEVVLRRLDESGAVEVVVVVDNASSYDVAAAVRACGLATPVHVMAYTTNRGSAAAIASGLRACAELDVSHVLLLDDDNLPAPGAVADVVRRLPELGRRDGFVLHRTSRADIRRMVQTRRSLGPVTDGFAGFSVRVQVQRALAQRRHGPMREGPLTLARAPYGGLVVSSRLIDDIGAPRAEYFLYADDYEFTDRICRAGGILTLVESALLHDLEDSWHQLPRRTRIAMSDLDASPERVYYSLRNSAHMEIAGGRTRSLESRSNQLAFWVVVAYDLAVQWTGRRGRWPDVVRRLRLLREAVRDARNEQLGARAVELGG